MVAGRAFDPSFARRRRDGTKRGTPCSVRRCCRATSRRACAISSSTKPEMRASAIDDLVRHARGDDAVRARAIPLLDEAPHGRASTRARGRRRRPRRSRGDGGGDRAARRRRRRRRARPPDGDQRARRDRRRTRAAAPPPRAHGRAPRGALPGDHRVRARRRSSAGGSTRPRSTMRSSRRRTTTTTRSCHIALRVAEERIDAGTRPRRGSSRARARCSMRRSSPHVALVAAILLAKAGDERGHDIILRVVRGEKIGGQAPDKEDERAAVELAGELGLEGGSSASRAARVGRRALRPRHVSLPRADRARADGARSRAKKEILERARVAASRGARGRRRVGGSRADDGGARTLIAKLTAARRRSRARARGARRALERRRRRRRERDVSSPAGPASDLRYRGGGPRRELVPEGERAGRSSRDLGAVHDLRAARRSSAGRRGVGDRVRSPSRSRRDQDRRSRSSRRASRRTRSTSRSTAARSRSSARAARSRAARGSLTWDLAIGPALARRRSSISRRARCTRTGCRRRRSSSRRSPTAARAARSRSIAAAATSTTWEVDEWPAMIGHNWGGRTPSSTPGCTATRGTCRGPHVRGGERARADRPAALADGDVGVRALARTELGPLRASERSAKNRGSISLRRWEMTGEDGGLEVRVRRRRGDRRHRRPPLPEPRRADDVLPQHEARARAPRAPTCRAARPSPRRRARPRSRSARSEPDHGIRMYL